MIVCVKPCWIEHHFPKPFYSAIYDKNKHAFGYSEHSLPVLPLHSSSTFAAEGEGRPAKDIFILSWSVLPVANLMLTYLK